MRANATGTSQQLGFCSDNDWCKAIFNTGTQKQEGTYHRWMQFHHNSLKDIRDGAQDVTTYSEWEWAAKVLKKRGLVVDVPVKVAADPPSDADCGGAISWEPDPPTSPPLDSVVVVMDRSGSMATPVDAPATGGAGSRESRLAFGKAAAREFLDLIWLRPGASKVGLVSFSDSVTEDQAIAQVVVNPSPPAGQVDLTRFKNVIIGGLNSGGFTAIGLGLARARDMLEAQSPAPMAKTVVLLSDGENNRPLDGSSDPRDVAQTLKDKGIVVYTIPTGRSADRMLLGDIAQITGGHMFDAPAGTELPAVFAEIQARAHGESLVLPRTAVDLVGSSGCEIDSSTCPAGQERIFPPEGFGCMCVPPGRAADAVKSFGFDIEAGASNLNVAISTRNEDIASWKPRFTLINPAGQNVLFDTSTGVVKDGFYQVGRVASPMPGRWKVALAARDFGSQQFQYVLAHVENSAPDCFARVSNVKVGAAQPAVVAARAYFQDRPLGQPTTYTGSVRRPDGSVFPLTFTQKADSEEAVALLTPDAYVGRGIYDVSVKCSAASDVQFALGEDQQGPLDGEEGPSLVPAFSREVRTGFFVDSPTQPPLPPGDDCDGNGIPNGAESLADTDGDGLPDVCDQDDDGDDLPDPVDPRPQDPLCQSASCPIASAGPDQLLQCQAAGGASAVLDGSASTDPNNAPLSFQWTASVPLLNANMSVATGTFPVGTSTANLAVSNGTTASSDSVAITVLDTTPPTLTVPPDITIRACSQPNLGQATASDGCGGSVTIVNNAPPVFTLGTHLVTWRAVDRFGNVTFKTQTVTVELGDDPSCCPSGTTVKVGKAGDDVITGTNGNDCLLGLGGNDNISGAGGNDFISGGDGSDNLSGSEGNDTIYGNAGQNVLSGQDGADTLIGGDDNEILSGGNGNDVLRGGKGADVLAGDNDQDQLFGEDGDDTLQGGAGNDALNGGSGSDSCTGAPGTDTLTSCER